jgi:hypothetical protein
MMFGRSARVMQLELTFCAADFRVRTCPLQDSEPDLPDIAPDSGLSTPGLSASLSHRSSSSKTCLGCVRADCGECSRTFPSSGSMRNGAISGHGTWARRIDVRASSSSLPTPTASTYHSNRGGSAGRVGRERYSIDSLLRIASLPTPTVCGDWNRRGSSQTSGDGLSSVAGTSVRLREWMMGFPEGWTLAPVAKPSATP